MNLEVDHISNQIKEANKFIHLVKEELSKVIVGQKVFIERLIIAILADGHVLVEGVPGLAKTLVVKTFARCFNLSFSRIQFTPDMLPADIIGTQIYSIHSGNFHTKKGPVFANIVLADEINRAPAKVQSALLEAMQERQVTIGDQSYNLPLPFLVLATQNPIEHEGTYPLPEAQLDRFLIKIKVGYPSPSEERQILERMGKIGLIPEVNVVAGIEEILNARNIINRIYMDERVCNYIVDIVYATREPERYKLPIKRFIALGASPRATIALGLCAKAHAFVNGRGYVIPEDVKAIAYDVLRHRILLTYEAEAEEKSAEWIIHEILTKIPVP